MDPVLPKAVPPSRRRDKAQLSCTYCRQKKLRCDRQKPCQTCLRRGVAVACTYPPTSGLPRPRAPSSSDAAAQPSLLERLDNLEYSLISLMNGAGIVGPQLPAKPPAKFDTEPYPAKAPVSHSPATLAPVTICSRSSASSYLSSAHWTSILDSISELRACCERDNRNSGFPEQYHRLDPPPDAETELLSSKEPHLLSTHSRTPAKADLLSDLPERSVVDWHVFQYFNTLPMMYLHVPSFFRQYEAFWANPAEVSVLWLSLLYSIICMTPPNHVASAAAYNSTCLGQPGLYRPKYLDQVIQCLILGDYISGGPHAIEALHHYFILEHIRHRDPDVRNWSLYGLILRIALREGYHRDPSRLSGITPFEGEMRRRLWAMLYGMDVLISIQMGIPRLIKDEQCDTVFPYNLYDTDFDEHTESLPLPRPDSEITPVMFWMARYRMMIIMAKINDMNLTIANNDAPCSRPQIEQIDTLLRTTYNQLPDTMKLTSISACLLDSPEAIANKLAIGILLQKGLIFLHRRHVAGKGSSEGSLYSVEHKCNANCVDESVRTCTDAALQMLDYQALFYYESQDGGALVPLRWRLLSSPITHEFLMATSVLCSYLSRVYRGDPDMVGAPAERIRTVEKALARSYIIWEAQSTDSKDAKRATDSLSILLRKT